MRRWVRAKLQTLCGLCGRVIVATEPMQLIEGTWTIPKIRCPGCADGSVDEAEIAADDARVAGIESQQPLASQHTTYVDAEELPYDAKVAASGDS